LPFHAIAKASSALRLLGQSLREAKISRRSQVSARVASELDAAANATRAVIWS
jgi:hypothetical protein